MFSGRPVRHQAIRLMARSGCFDVSRGDSDVTLRYTLHFGVTHNLAIPPSLHISLSIYRARSYRIQATLLTNAADFWMIVKTSRAT